MGGLEHTLSPVHTGDYSRRIRRLSPKTASVAKFGDKLSPFASVDSSLQYCAYISRPRFSVV